MTTPSAMLAAGLPAGPVRRGMWIEGAGVEAASGARFTRASPAHDVEVSSYPEAGDADVARAVQAARRAADGSDWPLLPGALRAQALQRVAELIRRDAEDLALVEVLESGKPITQARAEVASAADLWDYAATLARHAYGDAHSNLGVDMLAVVLREPVGVVAMITPWNFPLLIASQKLPFALAVGCTAVVKPSQLTPGSTVLLAKLTAEAGIPVGVVNVLTGGDAVGARLCEHPEVDMISFTGSTAVGRQVAATAGSGLKRVALELGGKNPQIVFADADLSAAAEAIVHGVSFNQGECCNAGSRALAEESIAAELGALIRERAARVVIGDPLAPATQVGAIVSDEQLARIENYVRQGTAAGAKLEIGGSRLPTPAGRFFPTTVFSGVSAEMTIAREEIFGPVLTVQTFTGPEEALRLANATAYGLSAGVWTRDLDTALRLSRGLRAGTVWVNTWLDGYPELPFGGRGASGLGRELGRGAIEEFTETKTVQLHLGPHTPRWAEPGGGRP